VALFDDRTSEALDGIGKIEIHPASAGTDALPFVTRLLRRARSDVARREVPEARVFALEVIIALALRDLPRRTRVALRLRHPDASVIAQRLRHERQLRLIVAALRNARGVDLRVARIGERRAALVRAPDRGGIRRLGVRR